MWSSASLQPSTGYYHYDSTLAAYGYSAGYDLAARRKNATRESTATLKSWLNEHKKNPYPTKGEKIMLAIITKMTLTQVSTWFANARRRLKKENKMTWEPKNKTDDDDDDDAGSSECEDKDKDDMLMGDEKHCNKDVRKDGHGDHMMGGQGVMSDGDDDRKPMLQHLYHPDQMHHMKVHHHHVMQDDHHQDCGIPLPPTKPKIWSLADTAASKTPPPGHQWPNVISPSLASPGFTMPNSSSLSPSGSSYSRYGANGFYGSGYNGGNSNSSSSSAQQMAGYPDVQTDTPPQTPPNMKLPLSASSGQQQQQQQQQFGGHQGAYNGYHHQQQHQQQQQHNYHHRQHVPPLQQQQQQQHDVVRSAQEVQQQQQQYHQQHVALNQHNNNNNNTNTNNNNHQMAVAANDASTAFKPFYKTPSQQPHQQPPHQQQHQQQQHRQMNGFVSPV